jgi:hypothetical protein
MQLTESSCVVRLDRVQIVSRAAPGWRPPMLRGYKVRRDTFVRRQTSIQTYERCRQYESLTNGTKIYWQYCPKAPWLKPWKITIVADDRYGLSRREVEQIVNHCSDYRLLLVELAVDFSLSSRITAQFVRQHAVFGKSHRHA